MIILAFHNCDKILKNKGGKIYCGSQSQRCQFMFWGVFLGCGEAEHRGRRTRGEESCLSRGSQKAKRTKNSQIERGEGPAIPSEGVPCDPLFPS